MTIIRKEGETKMACMEHACRECGHVWFDNSVLHTCPECGSNDCSNMFDENE